jgi:hypothetical protein
MSITAFKKKSVIQYGSKRSGKPPGGFWLPQGPFGKSTLVLQDAINSYGPVGFSLNGPHRNVGYVGQSMRMSKNGTPYRGAYPLGNGGTYGKYATPLPSFNVNEVIVQGEQQYYVKPTVLTTYGMLRKKYRWAYNGQYPNNWVQPNYGGTWQSDTKSQGNYISNISTANDCVTDVNAAAKYVGFKKCCGPTLCYNTTARFRFDDVARNGRYTKFIRNPQTSSQHTQHIQRRCTAPTGRQKPFPFATNGSNCNNQVYLSPPEWYIKSENNTVEG